MQDKAIALHDVDLSLGRGAARVHILKGISLDIARGEAVGLVGPSGSGKSTLLMTMAGLERPDSGRIVVDGTDLSGLDEDALARFRGRRIGIVFQSFHLVPTMTALENVALPLELAGKDERLRARRGRAAGGGLRPSPAPLSGAAFGRRAAARGDRPRHRAGSGDPGGGRADRQSRRDYRPVHHRPALRPQARPRRDPGARDPRSQPRPPLRPHGPPALGPGRGRRGLRRRLKDHLSCTAPFPPRRRDGLPPAPACRSCCASPSASCAAACKASASSSPASRSASRRSPASPPSPARLPRASPARAGGSSAATWPFPCSSARRQGPNAPSWKPRDGSHVVATMRAMAVAGEKGSGLVEMKAVDGGYPTVGALETDPQLAPADLFAERERRLRRGGRPGAARAARPEGRRPGDGRRRQRGVAGAPRSPSPTRSPTASASGRGFCCRRRR